MMLAPFFLNVSVLNKDEVVRAKVGVCAAAALSPQRLTDGTRTLIHDGQVQEKVPQGFFGIAGRLAAGAASAMVSDDKFTTGVASKLTETIPSKVADMGITLQLTTSYQSGSFVVLRAQVTAVDTPVLLAKAKGDEFAAKFAALMELLDYFQASEAKINVEQKVRDKVQDALFAKLEELLPAKLQEANVSVTVTAKRDADQAEFFYAFLATLGSN